MDEEPTDRARQAKRDSPYLTTDQAAHYLGVSRRYLQRLRAAGKGPDWRRHSTIVHYHLDDLIRWSAARTRGDGE